ncbi:MAG TPA: GDSL-type esterase/lipase family protein [Thermoanaerobaculia bacterium]|nr:GDSL-type esterase/lipase family protein [Thermoanaerobaculia bacterium]
MSSASSRFWLWRLPAAIGVLATLLFGAGFWIAVRGAVGSPLGEAPPPARPEPESAMKKGGRLLLVLGDSLARGTGDEMGRGFAADVLDGLKKRGPVQIANFAVNGAESTEVKELVERPNVRSVAASADWILLSVGGNDLSHAAPRGGASPAAPVESVARARASFAENLRAILSSLRDANPSAPIRVLGLYDPFEGDGGPSRLGASVILGWNSVLSETALSYRDVVVVPSFDLFQLHPDRLAVDRFHPNRAGYALIAARFLQVLG